MSALLTPEAMKAIRRFQLNESCPFHDFAEAGFVHRIYGAQAGLIAALEAAVEAELLHTPMLAALDGLMILNALGSFSEGCRESAQ